VPAKRSHPFQIRLTAREFTAWKRAARLTEQPIADWARSILNAAAVPPAPIVPPVVSGDQVELPLAANGKRRP